ncbi:MAG TPA: MarR family winged helix-turn-helix transcriptional regulator [Ramlibacter sp.]|nr:MarR family winged helix-turn-helix transcriptional regulator [Ramlibacter sp.]
MTARKRPTRQSRPDERVIALPARPPARAKSPRREISSVEDLERYLPAFLNWIASKLMRGASQHYLNVFDVGIETWRCLMLLAIENSISAQRVSSIIGMDKGSVSRCFKRMQARGLITMALDDADGRLRIARLTAKGRRLHDQMIGIALERERAFVEVLAPAELDTLIGLLQRLHKNLPAVEEATARYVAQRYPKAVARRRSRAAEAEDE